MKVLSLQCNASISYLFNLGQKFHFVVLDNWYFMYRSFAQCDQRLPYKLKIPSSPGNYPAIPTTLLLFTFLKLIGRVLHFFKNENQKVCILILLTITFFIGDKTIMSCVNIVL